MTNTINDAAPPTLNHVLGQKRPNATCLYSLASMWPRILSAACQRVASKPRLPPLPLALADFFLLAVFFVRFATGEPHQAGDVPGCKTPREVPKQIRSIRVPEIVV